MARRPSRWRRSVGSVSSRPCGARLRVDACRAAPRRAAPSAPGRTTSTPRRARSGRGRAADLDEVGGATVVVDAARLEPRARVLDRAARHQRHRQPHAARLDGFRQHRAVDDGDSHAPSTSASGESAAAFHTKRSSAWPSRRRARRHRCACVSPKPGATKKSPASSISLSCARSLAPIAGAPPVGRLPLGGRLPGRACWQTAGTPCAPPRRRRARRPRPRAGAASPTSRSRASGRPGS